jgi:hypothetical protein
MRRRLVCAGIASALLVVPLAEGGGAVVHAGAVQSAQTPDQQLVVALTTVRNTARAAAASLAKPSKPRVAKARSDIRRSIAGAIVAGKAALAAVGALDTRSVQAALERAGSLVRDARADVQGERFAAARSKLTRAADLADAALGDFGVPLAKEFPAFAVNRDFGYLPEFVNYSGLSARVGSEITEVVVGAANRSTANVGERGAVLDDTVGLPITRMSVAVISDPIGRFSSGWCQLDLGVITCRIRPAMPTDHVFTIAFGPKLPKGTKLLVKFRTATGERSYSVFTTR